MKDFMKTVVIISAAFGAGYLYSEYKAGRNFEFDNEFISFKLKANDEPMVDVIEEAISDALDGDK